MRWIALALALLTQVAHAENFDGYRWTRVHTPTSEPTITVQHVSTLELDKLVSMRSERGVAGIKQNRDHGFAQLVRRKDGSYHCTISVTTNASEAVIEHEKMHCQGFAH